MRKQLILFFTAFLQVNFVAMNVIFIHSGNIPLMAITGFLISLMWTLNVKKISIGSWGDRILYCLGAMAGTVTGYLISNISS